MTRDEILAMPAGREMDALVATEVMEWHWYKFIEPEYVDFGAKGAWLDSGNRVMHNEWYPSTDIGAAWEVVEKMKNDWQQIIPSWARFWRIVSLRDGTWDVMVGTENATTQRIIARATDKSLPLAICRAALLTVMEEK